MPHLLLLILLALVQFTNVLDFMIIMPLNPLLSREFEMNPTLFSFVVSSYAISASISGIAASFFLDKFDRKNSLLVTYSGFILGTFLCSLSSDYSMLIAARIFTGLFGGILGAQVFAIVSDTIPFEKRGAAMGVIMSSFSVAAILGVPIALYLSTAFNWRAPFFAICLLAIPTLFIALWKLPKMNRHLGVDRDRSSIFSVIRKSRSQQYALAMMFIMMVGHFMIVPNVADYLVGNVGVNENQLFWVYFCGGAVTLISNPLIGVLSDRVGKAPVFIVFLLLTFIPVLLITNLPPWPLALVLLITSSFFAFSSGRFGPAQALISETVNPSHRGAFMSILSAIQQFGAGFGAIIAGSILTKSASGEIQHFNIAGYVCILFSLCTLFFIRRIKIIEH